MALLQRTRILSNQRLDLPDYQNLENFICADFSAIHKYVWSQNNYVISGFEASGEGTNLLSVEVAEAACIIGLDKGEMYIGAPTLNPIETTALTPNATNYVEIFIEQDSGGADSRAFWDQTAAGGEGGEFSQIVDTFIFLKASFAINTSNFTSDADKVPVCEVDVDSGGLITAIRDSRPMFFRLGRPNDPSYSFSWTNGRLPETNTYNYNNPDKIITSVKQMFDALMDSVREIKGTDYWYEAPFTSLVGTFQNSALSVLTGANNTASFKWDGTNLQITDASPSVPNPENDVIAYLRLLNSDKELTLTRQDTNLSFPEGPIALDDGDVLWLEIANPAANTTYASVGSSGTNYRVSPRGSVPLNESTYWLAYREGTRIYLRGFGELEAGEEQQINDETTTALSTFLGFDPEIATSVPYSDTPDALIFGNVFDTSSALVEAISANTANINGIGAALQENAYEEHQLIVSGVPANDNELQGPIAPSTILSLPPDSRDGDSAQQYLVGDGLLHIYHDGQFLIRGVDWQEVGTPGTLSSQIEIINRTIDIGEYLSFRIDSLGGFNVGAEGSGDVTGASNLGGGEGNIFKQKTAGILELRTIKAGAGISVIQSGDQIIISTTGGAPTPYFRSYITGQTGSLVSTGGPYNLGENKLDVYRNGTLLAESLTAGNPEDRYQEATNNTISLSSLAPAETSEIFTFVNQSDTPAYKVVITGVTGTSIVVPSYTQGDNSLRIWRNGVLMNASSIGTVIDQYTETSTTSITLASAAIANEVFVVASGPVPTAREDKTGLTGSVITLINSYLQNSEELLVYRNGSLMYNSTELGNSTERYAETTSNSITLENAAVGTEWFSFIFK